MADDTAIQQSTAYSYATWSTWVGRIWLEYTIQNNIPLSLLAMTDLVGRWKHMPVVFEDGSVLTQHIFGIREEVMRVEKWKPLDQELVGDTAPGLRKKELKEKIEFFQITWMI